MFIVFYKNKEICHYVGQAKPSLEEFVKQSLETKKKEENAENPPDRQIGEAGQTNEQDGTALQVEEAGK